MMDFLPGLKTYFAAFGLFGLAIYQFTEGEMEAAWQSLLGGLGLIGLRGAVSRNGSGS